MLKQSSEGNQPQQAIVNRGWRVTLAGTGINLALGILYTWSVISKNIPEDWGWNEMQKAWPYSIACLVFALTMVPAGRLQDKLGPRLAATIGGVLVGVGMVLASMTTSYTGYMLGFGLLAGAGIGFGYASATPPAVKWFPAARTGMIAGIVVSGFGLASVYAAPLSEWLIHTFNKLSAGQGVPWTMFTLGAAFLVVVVGLAQLLTPPPKGYVPAGSPPPPTAGTVHRKEDFSALEMLATWQFYVLWFMYACGAGAGLMIIAKLSKIADFQAGVKLGFVLVAALAVGNGGGRILAGIASDKLGRTTTMLVCFVLQAVLMIVLSLANQGTVLANVPALAIISALIGANYGANLALFPAITKDFYGLKNFGINYGLVFTAWGAGGFLLALLAGWLFDRFQNFHYACYTAAGLLILAAIVSLVMRPPKHVHVQN